MAKYKTVALSSIDMAIRWLKKDDVEYKAATIAALKTAEQYLHKLDGSATDYAAHKKRGT